MKQGDRKIDGEGMDGRWRRVERGGQSGKGEGEGGGEEEEEGEKKKTGTRRLSQSLAL